MSVGGLVLDSTKWQKDTPQSKWQDANYRLVENDFGRYNLVAKKNQDKVLADVNFHRQLEKLTEAGWENFGLMNIDRIPDNVVKSGLKSRNSGGKGHDVIDGGADNDHLRGNAGDDKLIGGQGDDALHGGPGNDILDGGSGTNYMFGKALWRTKVSIKLQKRVVLKRKG
ncbi:MAG: hypothetical protein O4806_20990 [Trichodesmium sp. St5_bin8]|nr:hypothetical protein [Trichodesmium sp. St5_bin8]